MVCSHFLCYDLRCPDDTNLEWMRVPSLSILPRDDGHCSFDGNPDGNPRKTGQLSSVSSK